MSGFPKPVDLALTAPLTLPVAPGEPLTTESGTVLDDGSGDLTVSGNCHLGTTVVNGYLTSSLAVVAESGIQTTPFVNYSPAVPASGVAINPYQQSSMITYITASSLSAVTVAINGSTVCVIPEAQVGTIYLHNLDSITLTYSTAPTWVWTNL